MRRGWYVFDWKAFLSIAMQHGSFWKLCSVFAEQTHCRVLGYVWVLRSLIECQGHRSKNISHKIFASQVETCFKDHGLLIFNIHSISWSKLFNIKIVSRSISKFYFSNLIIWKKVTRTAFIPIHFHCNKLYSNAPK